MSTDWNAEFRGRMARFGTKKREGFAPVSIKVRVTGDCFHREHSPEAYRVIDDYVSRADLSDVNHEIVEHESGPEILVYLAAGLTLAKPIIELVTAIIKARSQGIKRGDTPSQPLEIIVRGHTKDGEYTEETIMRIPSGTSITPKQLEDVFPKRSKLSSTKTRKKKSR